MCFSATASFTAAAVLTTAGGAALSRAVRLRMTPGMVALASFPLLFGLQQGLEGLVWLGIAGALPPGWEPWTTAAFLFFALFLWPAAGPIVGWLLESDPTRRRIFAGVSVAGVALGTYLFATALNHPTPPTAPAHLGGHVVYLFGLRFPPGVEFVYFVIASTALVGSSVRDARLFGWALAISFVATALLWDREVLPSVWCFFAAGSSVLVLRAVIRRDPLFGAAAG